MPRAASGFVRSSPDVPQAAQRTAIGEAVPSDPIQREALALQRTAPAESKAGQTRISRVNTGRGHHSL